MADLISQDIDTVTFIGKPPPPEPGTATEHSAIGAITSRMFPTRKLEDVAADWKKVIAQIQRMVEATTSAASERFAVDSVEVSLGFSAKGELAFIAEAGVEATVKITLKSPPNKAQLGAR